jgi:hypothetical protein
MAFAAGLLFLLWVVASILSNGIAPLHRLTKLRGLELIVYGAAAGVVLHALLGWAIAAAPGARLVFVLGLIAVTLGSTAYLILGRVVQEFGQALVAPIKLAFFLWGGFLVFCLALLHVSVRLPEPLPDGMYVLKAPTTNVRVQHLTGLPADNYTAFAVSEFLLRGVSFETERPIMPANEVSNRTIAMSLVALPFRAALGAPRDHPQLGTYNYVGRTWPDVSKLYTDAGFEQFSIVGLVLNSLLLLGLLVFCSSLAPASVASVTALLYVTNSYFISQTLYTWPKAFAGFFILLAWNSIRAGHHAVVVAALVAFAFHCHPYAVVFAGWIAVFYLVEMLRGKSGPRSLFLYLLAVGLFIAPWFVWTRCVLQIPSDLIIQNFAGPGSEAAWASPMTFIWIRFHNLFYTTFSTIFTIYPFNFPVILRCWLESLPGAVGIVLIYPALRQCGEIAKPRSWLWYGMIAPALSILAVYSTPSLLILHGYQPILALLLFLGVWWLWRHCPPKLYLGLIASQVLLNLGVVVARGLIAGVHF